MHGKNTTAASYFLCAWSPRQQGPVCDQYHGEADIRAGGQDVVREEHVSVSQLVWNNVEPSRTFTSAICAVVCQLLYRDYFPLCSFPRWKDFLEKTISLVASSSPLSNHRSTPTS